MVTDWSQNPNFPLYNDSITHVDFMIGSAEMDIDGIKADGTSEPVFRKGNWAF
ncbi:aminopeptidase [Priestia megaterium]|nr:aminopeptidase [Priestia megaterium]